MSSHQRGAKCCYWAWEGAPGPEDGTPETPGRVQPHSLLRESVTERRASHALGLLHRNRPCFISPDEGPALRHTLVPPTTTGNQDAAGGVERSPAVPPTTTGPPPGVGPQAPPQRRAYLLRTPCSERRGGDVGSLPLSGSPCGLLPRGRRLWERGRCLLRRPAPPVTHD